ncbi:cytochrome P450 [Xylariaceae sp. FL1019]|nr:cytochrome P450 [Xylariaceae sp. FL1019]
MSVSHAFVVYALPAFTVYVLALISYRLFLHPLHHFPGPLIAKISDVYGGYYALRRRLHLETLRNHLEFGSAVRAGPNRLVFNSIEALRDIYQNDRIVKPEIYRGAQTRPDQSNVFNTRDKNVHRFKRRIIGQALSDQSMRAFEPTLLEQVDVFLKVLLDSQSSPVNISPAVRHLGLDVIGQLGFGYDLKLQTDDSHRFLKDGVMFSNFRINLVFQLPALLGFRPDLIASKLPNSIRAKLLNTVEKMVRSRLAEPLDAKHDLLSFAADKLGSSSDGSDVREGDLWPEAVFFFGAGGDTTATAMAATFFYLSKNPQSYHRLATEIRSTFKSGAQIKGGSQLASCRFLRACIDESLRMSPSVPTTPWRQLDPSSNESEPLVVDGHVIPRDTLVGVNTYSLHHNEEYFPSPFTFDPERWLEQGGPGQNRETLEVMRRAFVPFSVGARACAGRPLAYLEASLTVAKTIWYFDFEPASGDLGLVGGGVVGNADGRDRVDEFQVYDIFGASHDGPNLVFRPRNSVIDELA